MAQSPNISLQPEFTYLISGSNPSSLQLLNSAWQKMDQAYRPSTSSAHRTHFRTFISFIYFMDLPMSVTLHNMLVFLEYLHQNSLSPKVIKNYLSSIATMSKAYSIDYTATHHPAVLRYIRGLSLTFPFRPTPRGIFDIPTLYAISKQCETLSDPILLTAIFLTSFYAFLRMSNIASHSSKQFNPKRHLLRQDVIFAPPGAHIILKWCKTMQDAKSTHIVQIPEIANIWLCPVRALKTLLVSRNLTSTSPLFANAFYSHSQVTDTHIRDGGPRWQSGNTLASHLCGWGSIPVMAVSGKAGSCLPLVVQFTVQNPSALYVLVSSALPTTRRDMTCTVLKATSKNPK